MHWEIKNIKITVTETETKSCIYNPPIFCYCKYKILLKIAFFHRDFQKNRWNSFLKRKIVTNWRFEVLGSESFFYIKGFEISVRDVNLVSKCLFSRSGHTTIQDGLLNKSRDLFSKASWIVVCPLHENECFQGKMVYENYNQVTKWLDETLTPLPPRLPT